MKKQATQDDALRALLLTKAAETKEETRAEPAKKAKPAAAPATAGIVAATAARGAATAGAGAAGAGPAWPTHVKRHHVLFRNLHRPKSTRWSGRAGATGVAASHIYKRMKEKAALMAKPGASDQGTNNAFLNGYLVGYHESGIPKQPTA